MTVYLDASAAAKLLVEEPESPALIAYLERVMTDDIAVVSSTLLETELRRFAVRVGLPQASVSEVVDQIALAEPDRALFAEAGILPGRSLRTLDAIHVASALRLNVDEVVAYDWRLLEGATTVGLRTVSPR